MSDTNYEIEPEDAPKKGKTKRMRNLSQYRDLSDEKFEELMSKRESELGLSKEFEEKIKEKLAEFDKDYDLSDLKANDWMSLRAFVQAIISLEDYEQVLFRIRKAGILGNDEAFKIEKLQKIMSDLRSDISRFQNDLNITRKIRKSDQDVSVQAYIDDVKSKAKKFLESRMSYIFCPKCNMLLGTIWALYPDNERNKIALICQRTLDDGTECGEKVVVTTKELLDNRGTNKKQITPESML